VAGTYGYHLALKGQLRAVTISPFYECFVNTLRAGSHKMLACTGRQAGTFA